MQTKKDGKEHQENKSSQDTPGPSNPDGTNKNLEIPKIKISDFGLAAKVNTEEAKEFAGTKEYIAPEVWYSELSRKYKARIYAGPESDVYTLALIAFKLANKGMDLIDCMESNVKIAKMLADKKTAWKSKYRKLGCDRMLEDISLDNKRHRWLHKRTGELLPEVTDNEFFLALAPALERDPTKRTKNAKGLLKLLEKGLQLQKEQQILQQARQRLQQARQRWQEQWILQKQQASQRQQEWIKQEEQKNDSQFPKKVQEELVIHVDNKGSSESRHPTITTQHETTKKIGTEGASSSGEVSWQAKSQQELSGQFTITGYLIVCS